MQSALSYRRPPGSPWRAFSRHARAMFLVWVLVSCLNDSCSDGPPAVLVETAVASTESPLGDCLPETRVRALCQNCAALIKAHKAYRMCCTDESGNSTESVRDYCVRLLEHTVGGAGLVTKKRGGGAGAR
ncbi:unnamed protein product [Ixodes pacificus]